MDFSIQRTKMVDNQIRTTDVTDLELLRAFLTVPREEFVQEGRRDLAYIDAKLPLGRGRFMMEPSPLAKLLQLARVRPDDFVLDVGCGTGYSAAVLAELGASVVALEEDGDLAGRAQAVLGRLGVVSSAVVEGPLVEGCAAEAPYDVILFEGAVAKVPEIFFVQLKERGRLVVVEGFGNAAMAKLYLKEGGLVSDRFGFNCSLPALPGFEPQAVFVF